MSGATAPQRGVLPVGTTPPEELRRLMRLLRPRPEPVGESPRELPMLVGSSGDEMLLPQAIYNLLCDIVPRLMRGEEIVVLREDRPLTTQQAADLLGMSRPYLKGLLDKNIIPYHRVGTHRRLQFADVMTYKVRRDAERMSKMDELIALSDELGVYE